MQSSSKHSTNSSPSPDASTSDNKATGLSANRSLRARTRSHASPDHDLDLHIPIRDLIALGSDAARSNKIKLHLKRRSADASTSPPSLVCVICHRRFSTPANLLRHLHTDHSLSEEQAHDHEQGEDNGGGDSGAKKKSEEEKEGSCAASDKGKDGLDLNQPIDEEAQASASADEKNEEKDGCGDETSDGPRKKIRFDLNELPSQDEPDN